MSNWEQLNKLYENALQINYDSSSKFVFISDCHRGDESGADNFRQNRNIFIAALRYYYKRNFTYFELGDGDELWANKDFNKITKVNKDVFEILSQFYANDRFYSIYGNHDMIKKNKKWVRNNLWEYTAEATEQTFPLFPNIVIPESIVLTNPKTQNNIFLLHGHQVDFINDNLWRISRFLVRYLWRPLETLGIKNPITPVNSPSRKNTIEQKLADWSIDKNIMLICGHTHRAVLPKKDEPMYFNDGCCIYPHFITALEIENDAISLVKWSVTPDDDGVLTVARTVLKGPRKITDYFITTCTCYKVFYESNQ